jgi:hypothetical protein
MLDRLGRGQFAARSSFNPVALYAGGKVGGFWDVANRSTLFQDTAGTSLVTATGQSVARVNDLSGNGNNFTQGTAANQPTFQIDSAGRPYLSPDGVNDFMSLAINLTALSSATFWIAAYKPNDTSFEVAFEYGPNISTTAGFVLWKDAAAATVTAGHRGATGSDAVTRAVGSGASTFVSIGLSDIVAPSINARTNGALGTANTVATGGGNYGSNTLYVMARAGAGSWWSGRIYAWGFIQGLMATDDQVKLSAFLNSRVSAYA